MARNDTGDMVAGLLILLVVFAVLRPVCSPKVVVPPDPNEELAKVARAGVKEAQSLARHSTPDLTMNVYGRADRGRLSELAEAVGEVVLPTESIAIAQRKAVGAENYDPASGYVVEAGGIEPPSRDISELASTCVVCLLSATTKLSPLASANSGKQDFAPAPSTKFSPAARQGVALGQPAGCRLHRSRRQDREDVAAIMQPFAG